MLAPETNTTGNTDPFWDLAEAVAHLIRINTPNMSTDQMAIMLGVTTRLQRAAAAQSQGASTALDAARERLVDQAQVAQESDGLLGGIL